MPTSMMFRVFQWTAAGCFGGDPGTACPGTRGNAGGEPMETALAGTGAMATMAVTAEVNHRLRRDFCREWWKSLGVKQVSPLAGEEMARLPGAAGRERR